MNAFMTPMNFLAGTAVLGSLHEGWGLDQAPHGAPARTFRHHISFERPFSGTPLVHTGLSGFDISNQDSARITSRVENVSAEGFEIVVAAWLHTRVWRVDVNWLAIGS